MKIRNALPKVKFGSTLRLFLILLLAVPETGKAAFELDSPGPRATALGGAGVALVGDLWSPLRNPALAAEAPGGAGMSWSQQFELPELSREAICVNSTVRQLTVAIRGTNFGSKLYREGEFGLIIAYPLKNQVSLGAELTGKWIGIQDYSTGSAVAVGLGILVHPVNALKIGAVWSNLNSPRLTNYSDRIGEALRVGLMARVTDEAILVADVIQEEYFPAEFRGGLEARLLPNFHLRVGIRAEPVRPSAGFQFRVGRWGFNYGGDLHPDLGPSHEIGMEVRFGK